MRRAAIVLVALAACVAGAPPGFSKGDSWTIPLVGPLEDGALVTTVWVNDHGPYLFLIDPDSPRSTIDDGIVSEVAAYHYVTGDRYDDEQDTSHPTIDADALTLRIGNDLTVTHHPLWVTHVGTFEADGRVIRGVIGHDVIADSIVFGFDRDKGVAYLSVPKAFTPPPGAASFGYHFLTSHLTGMSVDLLPIGRRLTDATIDGKHYRLHVDLGAMPSQLREGFWRDAQLQPIDARAVLVDEIGTKRIASPAAIAHEVTAGAVTAHDVVFVPYDDRRWEREDIDGTLGLGFFRGVDVWVNLDAQRVYTTPRAASLDDDTRARLARWGSPVLASCPHPACFDISLVSAEGAPAGTPTLAYLHRDPQAAGLNLELTLEAVGKDGAPLGKPLMVAELAQGIDAMTAQIDPSYGDATLRVVDVSPFVRACPSPGKACLYSLAQ